VPWAASIHPIVPGLAVAFVLIMAVTPFTRMAPRPRSRRHPWWQRRGPTGQPRLTTTSSDSRRFR
jgi:hypothetical protein